MLAAMTRLLIACLCVLGLAVPAAAADADALAARHAILAPAMAVSAFGRPLVVQSIEADGRMQGEATGELAYPFESVARRLATPGAWCDVIVLHVNVKGCAAGADSITVYSGRKFYEPLGRTYAVHYTFRTAAARADYLRVELAADSGPLGTRDHAIVLEAMPMGERTFVALRYAFRPSAASRLATAAYLATLGSDKPGFTIVGRNGDGSPRWIGGVRGVVERNAMRYFLALDAWLATCDTPEADRPLVRFARMAALIGEYPVQLVEMPADEYVAMKVRERRDNAPGA